MLVDSVKIKASFKTHLNYIKCLDKLLDSLSLSVKAHKNVNKNQEAIDRYRKLYNVTLKSIKKDIELAKEDADFAVIVAPWFPVKCYYAIYYLESVLVNLIDGSNVGYGKGGHTGIRKKLHSLTSTGILNFNEDSLNSVRTLKAINELPPITTGENTRSGYWNNPKCTDSVFKKLCDYKLHETRIQKNWDLRTKESRLEKVNFLQKENLMLLDFFYWYRIKANYRDLDYIDFENGVESNEVVIYIQSYYSCFEKYRGQLAKIINQLNK